MPGTTIPYMPGTTVQGVPLLVYGTDRKTYRRVLYDALFKMVLRRRELALPSVTWRPSGRTGRFSYTTYLTPL